MEKSTGGGIFGLPFHENWTEIAKSFKMTRKCKTDVKLKQNQNIC